MTPERLDEIRERAAWTCRERGADIDALLAHVDHLTAENARLREEADETNDPRAVIVGGVLYDGEEGL